VIGKVFRSRRHKQRIRRVTHQDVARPTGLSDQVREELKALEA
jgi:hypothetical protein